MLIKRAEASSSKRLGTLSSSSQLGIGGPENYVSDSFRRARILTASQLSSLKAV